MAKPWFKNIFSSSESVETKKLKDSLEAKFAELQDQLTFNSKIFEPESNFTGVGEFELNGVEATVTPQALIKLYITEPWVRAAVDAIAETIAGTPWKLKKRTIVKKLVPDDAGGKEEQIEEVWSDATGTKLSDLFNYPNRHSSRFEFLVLIVIDLICTGNAYIYLRSDQDLSVFDRLSDDDNANSPFGRLRTEIANTTSVTALHRLPSIMITPVPKMAEEGFGLHGYLMNSGEGDFVFEPAEIIHIKFPNPLNQWVGMAPLMAAVMRLMLERYSTEHMIRFYKSGARLGGMIESEKNITPEQISRIQRSFENNYTGRQNFYRTLVLPNGMSYKPLEQNPVEQSVLELGKANRESILAVLRVPPLKAQVLDNANYANANAQIKIFYDDTIKPRCAMITDAFNMAPALIPDNHAFKLEFDFSDVAVLQENFQEKAKAAKEMIDGGMTVNEVRKKIWKLEAIDGGDKSMSIEMMQKYDPMLNGASATGEAGAASGDSALNAIADNQIADPNISLNGAQVTAMANIVSQVAQGFLPRSTGVEMIVVSFSVPRDAAERIMGAVGTAEFTPARDPSSAPIGDTAGIHAGKDIEAGESIDDPFANLPGPTVTSIMNIIGRVTRGKIAADAGAAMISAFGLDPALAHKLVGLEYVPPVATVIEEKTEVAPPSADPVIADQIHSTNMTYEQRVAQLVAQFMDTDKLPLDAAIARAIEQAKLEGYGGDDEPPTPPNGPKPSSDEKAPPLNEFLATALSTMDAETVDQSIIDRLVSDYERDYGQITDEQRSELQLPKPDKVYAMGMSKDQVVSDWKGFIEKTDPMIAERKAAVKAWFKRFESAVKNQIGSNVKAYGLHKSRDSDDADEILDQKNYKELVSAYIAEVDASLNTAYKYGFSDTLVKFEFAPNSDATKKALEAYAAAKVKGITDTTLDQLRDVLIKAFEEEVAITEITQRITEKFAEIEAGRAETIARTETLTAVSLGREAKRQETREQFPEVKFLKMWISAQDDKVRDSHADLDGQSVEVDAEFKSGLRFPRDPNGDASEVINCRCTDITYDADIKEIMSGQDSPKESEREKSVKYNPDQDRDNLGRFAGSGGGGSEGSDPKDPPRGPIVSLEDHNESGRSVITDNAVPGTKPWLTGGVNEGAGYDRESISAGPSSLPPEDETNHFRSGPHSDYTNSDRFNTIKGSELKLSDTSAFQKYASTEFEKNLSPAIKRAKEEFAKREIHILEVTSRTKEADSLVKKMNGKWADKTLDKVTDGIGTRFIVRNQQDADKLTAGIASATGLTVLEHKDYVANPKSTGYSAQHVTVRTPGGFMAEIQIKTENQQKFSSWAHDSIYKNESLNKNPEVNAYTSSVSSILRDIDQGKTPTAEVPAPPKVLIDAKLEFPWNSINKKPY